MRFKWAFGVVAWCLSAGVPAALGAVQATERQAEDEATDCYIDCLDGPMNEAARVNWPESYYNPAPLPEDVIMPMPCQGAMVFRHVFLPINKTVEDVAFIAGQEGTEWSYLEDARPAYVGGGFGTDEYRSYFIAKYEMSQLQYEALMGAECPEPTLAKRAPVVGLSWFDAVAAAHRYNLWLREKVWEFVPQEGDGLAYMRLPTEEEWEYAARGGAEVSADEFAALRYPMPEGLSHYEWFNATQSANGAVQLTGLLKPNPLGLHDMLGNVSEMMFEPFRLNQLGRLHGQVGGVVIRGGDYMSDASDIRSAHRREVSPYEEHQQTKKRIGFRWVMSSRVLSSRERLGEIEAAWQKKADEAFEQQSEAAEIEAAHRRYVANLEQEFTQHSTRLEQAENELLRAQLTVAAMQCQQLAEQAAYVTLLNEQQQYHCQVGGAGVGSDASAGAGADASAGAVFAGASNNRSCALSTKQHSNQRQRLEQMMQSYTTSVVSMADRFEPSAVQSASDQLGQAQPHELHPYYKAHYRNIDDYFKNKVINEKGWLQQCGG